MARHAIIRQNYVISVVEWEPKQAPEWKYPHPYDLILEDTSGSVNIGDWYEEQEGLFYRPVNGTPQDLPKELRP